MTTTTHKAEARGTIFYDGECNLCTAGAARLGPTLARRRFTAVPLQSPGAAEALGLSSDKLLDEVRLLTRDGRVLGGADALLHVARHVWWAWPLWLASFVPGVKPLLRYAYRRFVPYRYCVAGRCGRPAPAARTLARVVDAIPLILLPAAALLARPHVPPWAFMWLMAIAIFGGAKWLTWRSVPAELRRRPLRALAYLFAWPGMDARGFLDPQTPADPADTRSGAGAVVRIAIGCALVWGAARVVHTHSPLLAGWTGMIGMILLLHFGAFALLAMLWRRAGVNARPIMDRPLASTSVAEFWGRRWNSGFSELSRRYLFAPLHRRAGAAGAVVIAFLASGLVHELVITLPAGAGWGGPTAYFLIQAAAILLERTRPMRHVRGRAFMLLVTAGPLPLLFPPPFVERVILPFMHVIGALGVAPLRSPDLADWIRIAGLLHFGILIASALVPQVLDWRRELSKLGPLTRHLVWTHGAFIVLTIVGLGAISVLNAPALANGSMLSRSICAFIALFWMIRLGLQFFLFDARPYLTSAALKVGYHGLTVVFSILVIVYGCGALAP